MTAISYSNAATATVLQTLNLVLIMLVTCLRLRRRPRRVEAVSLLLALLGTYLLATGGDPAHTTEMLALNIYQTFYGRSGPQWKGYGQAKAVLFCILVVVIGLVQLKATRSKEVQQ